MYCANCGVKLADTEKACPLCRTQAYHPAISRPETDPLYPPVKPKASGNGAAALSGALLIVFAIPLLTCLVSDLQDGVLSWFFIVGGALALAYVILALPWWFKRPNPVIFVPCDFAAVLAYLLYLNVAMEGDWFLTFALPVAGGLGVVVSTVITLLRYLRGGRLYIFGGAFMALGGMVLLTEMLLTVTFGLPFVSWSFYPLGVLVLLGGLLIYLGINRTAREMMERKLFF